MSLLSSALWELKPRYDAVVIGSGYGGAIAASRLARATRPDGRRISVCVLERGNEIPTGEFPAHHKAAFEQCTLDAHGKRVGPENGLFRFHFDDQVTVLSGCGLGGTSLINANVSLEPQKDVFKDKHWPRAIQEDADGRLKAGFAQAEAMLRPTPYPEPYRPSKPTHGAANGATPGAAHGAANDATHGAANDATHGAANGAANGAVDGLNGRLLKYDVLKAAAGDRASVRRVPINVNLNEFDAGHNHVGIEQPVCSGCGDCVSGCNTGAKNSLTKNYLPDAKNHGADIFCGIDVRSVAKRSDGWAVYYVPLGQNRAMYDAPEMFVCADIVIVSAGSVGSTEIVLRSKQRGLACSDFVGHQFTGNGDFLGFAYNGETRVNGVGRGRFGTPANQPGPTITGVIDLRDEEKPSEERKPLKDRFIVEEGALPSALSKLLPVAFKIGSKAVGKDDDHSFWHGVRQWGRETVSVVTSLFGGAYRGALANTQTFLTMSFDEDKGMLSLKDDRIRIEWPRAGNQPVWRMVENKFRQLATATHATYVPSPLFTKYFNFDVLTVHPLGGCICADDATRGVVNERSQVFQETSGHAVYPGLYVMDGAIIPSPLGVNPLYTISALSERNVRLLIEDRGWSLDDSFTDAPAKFNGKREDKRPVTLQFSERMTGYLTPSTADCATAAESARALGHTATAIFGIMSPDLDEMVADQDRAAKLIGTVHIPALSRDPMTIYDGIFNLFVNVEGKTHKQMRYRMKLAASDGKHYYFDGRKEVRDDRGIDVYADTTHLFTTVHEGNEDGRIVAKGILKITADDVWRLVETMSAHDRNGKSSIRDCVRFGKLFVGDLWDVYGLKAKLMRH